MISISMGVNSVEGNEQNKYHLLGATDKKEELNYHIDASQLASSKGLQNQIEEKQGQAKKQAKKIMEDAWNRVQGMLNAREKLGVQKQKVSEELAELRGHLKQIDEYKESLREAYGVEKDSKEQKDLELLEKYQNNLRGTSSDSFSKEEVERLKELQNIPLTEYQKSALSLNGQKDSIYMEIDKKNNEIMELTGSMTNLKLELLKSQDMVKAETATEKLMEASGKEILGLLLEDGKEKADEKAKEEREKAEEIKEEKLKEEERKEEASKSQTSGAGNTQNDGVNQTESKEKKQQEDLIYAESEITKLQNAASFSKTGDSQIAEAQKAIQRILVENHMLPEELKGIEIDLDF